MITVACPKCKAELEFPDSLAGQQEACPDCNSPVLITMPARARHKGDRSMITVHCPKCRAELEFPDSLVGESDVCPDCQTAVAIQRVSASRATKVRRKRGPANYIFWTIFSILALIALWWCLTFPDRACVRVFGT